MNTLQVSEAAQIYQAEKARIIARGPEKENTLAPEEEILRAARSRIHERLQEINQDSLIREHENTDRLHYEQKEWGKDLWKMTDNLISQIGKV